jgi:class 3 adenylate cyclase/predicted ATPase
MQGLVPSEMFLFEGLRLDGSGGLFRHNDNGAFVPVAIGSRALDILRVLIARAGEVVSKDEIITAVWRGIAVEDSNLTVQISALRRVLDQGRSNGSCIQTVSGRGYRFIAPVTRSAVGAYSGTPVSADEQPWVFSRDGAEPSVPPANKRSSETQPSSIFSADRRQLTVLICDLVGSTMLSSRLDPEDLREVIAGYHRAVSETVAGFGGFVGNYMGDTVSVYFGYPRAHEDDAERAVRAGLSVVDAVAPLDLKYGKLQTRVGIATGMVVVSEGAFREQSVVGETPYLAAELKVLAEPGTVVVAASTYRLLGGLFEYRDLGCVQVKGIAPPVPVWQIMRPSAVASRFEALRGSSLTRLIGRDEEIDLLLRRWARAKSGDGQVVLVSGEPGIGKSRITAELEERVQLDSHALLRYFCSPHQQDSALHPFANQLVWASGFARDDPPASKLEKLGVLLARASPTDADVAFLADLLSLSASERHPLPDVSPHQKKERTLEALIRQLEGLARRQPLFIVFEDVHWIDPTSRELLDRAIKRVRELPVLLIVTFRPEFQPPWIGEAQVTMLTLNRLDRHDRTALIKQIAGAKALPESVIDQIADRSDGVPLFVEELTKSILESGLVRAEPDRYVLDQALPSFVIPTTLQDSLMARLDRSPSMRLAAQIGAVIGREFSYILLRAVYSLPETELQSALSQLVASELVLQLGTPPHAIYTFKHALVHDVAHNSLLHSTRQRIHAQIAEVLEAHTPELMDSQPELFAQHYAEAGLVEQSVVFWGKAGRRSAGRSAMAEAGRQFQSALEQLSLLEDTAERKRQELEYLGALGAVWLVVEGFAAPETGQVYSRARELWEQLGSPPEFLQIPFGQSRYHAHRGELDLAQRLDEDLLRLSRRRKDSAGLVLGHDSSGRNLFFSGRFRLSRSHLGEALTIYDPVSHGSLVHQAGFHPHVNSDAYLASVLFCLGYPNRALTRSTASIAEAQRLAHPPTLASSLALNCNLLYFLGDNAALEDRADQLLGVATEQGFPFFRAVATNFCGWVKAKRGDVAEGISLMRRGLAAYRATGAQVWTPHLLALLARAHESLGEVEDALMQLDDALKIVETTGERWLVGELFRQKGQLVLRQGRSESAENLYLKALNLAREQEAKLWELRAALSLARLRRDQSRCAEARDLLAPVYDWFTEGFDTPDLNEAKALLDGLC